MDLESRATKERIKETKNKVSKNYEPNSPPKKQEIYIRNHKHMGQSCLWD